MVKSICSPGAKPPAARAAGAARRARAARAIRARVAGEQVMVQLDGEQGGRPGCADGWKCREIREMKRPGAPEGAPAEQTSLSRWRKGMATLPACRTTRMASTTTRRTRRDKEGRRRIFKDFDCPTCSANNPYDDGFGDGDEVLCYYCGAEFKVLVNDEGRLRLREA